MSESGWKVLTHDLRPPIQGGEPLWTGALPVTLPAVAVDISDDDCGAGWNHTAHLDEAIRITGLFRHGRPVRAFIVTPSADAVVRQTKRRASTLTIEREASLAHWLALFQTLAEDWFPDHAAAMAREQYAWWRALTQPQSDPTAIEAGLTVALAARGLDWTLRRYDTARATWDAWAARATWDAWAARAARDARDARDGICTTYAARMGWITARPDRHTAGIRDAYAHGLAIALPVAPGVLGWAMKGDGE